MDRLSTATALLQKDEDWNMEDELAKHPFADSECDERALAPTQHSMMSSSFAMQHENHPREPRKSRARSEAWPAGARRRSHPRRSAATAMLGSWTPVTELLPKACIDTDLHQM
ncbi:unnamed protein product [Symbiodinium microadriaticum]|nr:unnamed protein product [Symbiodinium microadriaticum]CAE7938820.1 unnamed protein product [Symbiodinium sp. KB8]